MKYIYVRKNVQLFTADPFCSLDFKVRSCVPFAGFAVESITPFWRATVDRFTVTARANVPEISVQFSFTVSRGRCFGFEQSGQGVGGHECGERIVRGRGGWTTCKLLFTRPIRLRGNRFRRIVIGIRKSPPTRPDPTRPRRPKITRTRTPTSIQGRSRSSPTLINVGGGRGKRASPPPPPPLPRRGGNALRLDLESR